MSKKPKFTVWNKKNAKISSSKILKTQKKIAKENKEDASDPSPLMNYVKKFDEQIRNACK